MEVRVFFVLLLIGVYTTHALHTLIPEGKELVYEYNGMISASTHIPRRYTSSFMLNGNIRIQQHGQAVFAQLFDLTYQMYNGLEAKYESETLPLPEEFKDFHKVFKIEYEPSGNIAGITTEKEEQQYMTNFKKAISSMLQLDLDMVEKMMVNSEDSYGFHTHENTLYGKGKVYYNVKPGNTSYHIDVMQEPHSTQHMYTHMLTNAEYDSPMSDYDEPISRDNQRHCVLRTIPNDENDRVLFYVAQTGGIYYQPFNGKSDAHTVYVNQTLEFASLIPITSKLHMESENHHDDLTYHTADLHNIDGAMPDFTNGRRKWDKETLISTSMEMFKEIMDYIIEQKLDAKQTDIKKGQLITRLTRVMLNFDLETFKEFYEKLSEIEYKYLSYVYELYYQMLPILGTHAAYYHIRDLVITNNLSEPSLVEDMFANVKYPNKKLVDDMSDMINWGTDYEPIKHAAVLSFGTLLAKAVERNRRYTHAYARYGSKKQYKYGFNPNNNLEEDFPDHKYYEKYVIEIISQLKATKDTDQQVLYLQALYNTKMDSIVQHLLPAVKGDWSRDNYYRMMASLAISPIVTKNEDLTFEIFWPFMTNSDTPTSFRIMSYYMIMKSQPSLPRLINIYWVMQSIKNEDLYQFHYKYLVALSKSENPHMSKFLVHINQIIKYTYRPELRGLTGFYQLDYFDTDYSFGEEVKLLTIFPKHENDLILKASYKYNTDRLSATPYWAFIRISGYDESFLNDLQIDSTSTASLFTWENLWKSMWRLGKNSDAKITFILASNHHVIKFITFSKSNAKEIMATMQKLLREFKHDDGSLDLSNELSKTIVLPTDMGFPAVFQSYAPDVDYYNTFVTRTDDGALINMQFNMLIKNWMHSRRGLSFYNPVVDVWQGVNKYHAYNYDINIRFNMTVDTEHNTVKFTWKKLEDSSKDFHFNEKIYATTMVFVKDDFKTKILQKSNPKCNNFEMVSLGDEYKQEYTTVDYAIIDIGSHFIERVFDSEHNDIKTLEDYDNDDADFRKTLISIAHADRLAELDPEPLHYGIYRTLELKKIYPITDIEMIIQYNKEYKKGSYHLLPAVKHNLKLTYNAGDKVETLAGWNINAMLDMNEGHTLNAYKLHVSKSISEMGVKACIDGEQTWAPDSVKSSIIFSGNFLEDKPCSKDDPILTFKISAEKSDEQLSNKYSYSTCFEKMMGPMENLKSLECLTDYASLRKYTFNITHGLQQEQLKTLNKKIKESLSKLSDYESDKIMPNNDIGSNEIQMSIDFPMTKDVANVKLHLAEMALAFDDIPIESEEMILANTEYNGVFAFMHSYGLTDMCLIQDGKVTKMNGDKIELDMPTDWSLFLGDDKSATKFGIWIKSIGSGKMALKCVFESHTLLIEPKNERYEFMVDGELMSKDVYSSDWMHYGLVKDTKVVSIFLKNFGCHIIHNGHQVQIEYPQIADIDMHGHCAEKDMHKNLEHDNKV